MVAYQFIQVDAFTDRPLGGNPCAVLLGADDLPDTVMQAIAREQNLSETAFVLPSAQADWRARYFTPSSEIPLAGHPTIAVMVALADQGLIQVTAQPTNLALELAAGIVDITVVREDELVAVTMHQLPPHFGAMYEPARIMPAFGLEAADVLPGAVPQTVSTGTPQLMVPVRDLEALHRAQLDIPRYRALHKQSDFFSPHLFCTTGVTDAGATFARHFGLPPDTLEDPFTGSATGGMAAYGWRYGLLSRPSFIAEQGHWLGRPGQAKVSVSGPRAAIQGVAVSGTGVVVIRGTLTL